MISFENFRILRKFDLAAIAVFAFLWSVITYFISLADTYFTFVISLFITAMFIVLIAFSIRRTGSVFLFCLLGAFITVKINNLGGLGWNKLIVLGIVGIIFELFFLLLSIEIKNIPFDIVIGAGFSIASIPFSMLFLVEERVSGIAVSVWNFALTAFITGIMGAVLVFLIWHNIKNLKPVVKFEYRV